MTGMHSDYLMNWWTMTNTMDAEKLFISSDEVNEKKSVYLPAMLCILFAFQFEVTLVNRRHNKCQPYGA